MASPSSLFVDVVRRNPFSLEGLSMPVTNPEWERTSEERRALANLLRIEQLSRSQLKRLEVSSRYPFTTDQLLANSHFYWRTEQIPPAAIETVHIIASIEKPLLVARYNERFYKRHAAAALLQLNNPLDKTAVFRKLGALVATMGLADAANYLDTIVALAEVFYTDVHQAMYDSVVASDFASFPLAKEMLADLFATFYVPYIEGRPRMDTEDNKEITDYAVDLFNSHPILDMLRWINELQPAARRDGVRKHVAELLGLAMKQNDECNNLKFWWPQAPGDIPNDPLLDGAAFKTYVEEQFLNALVLRVAAALVLPTTANIPPLVKETLEAQAGERNGVRAYIEKMTGLTLTPQTAPKVYDDAIAKYYKAMFMFQSQRVRMNYLARALQPLTKDRLDTVARKLCRIPRTIDAPLVINRPESVSTPLILEVRMRVDGRVGGGTALTYKWFGPGGASRQSNPPASSALSDSWVVENPCPGEYWCEVSGDLELTDAKGDMLSYPTGLTSFRATLNVSGKCQRCGTRFDVNSLRVFGECVWAAHPLNSEMLHRRKNLAEEKGEHFDMCALPVVTYLDDSIQDKRGAVVCDDETLLCLSRLGKSAIRAKFFTLSGVVANINARRQGQGQAVSVVSAPLHDLLTTLLGEPPAVVRESERRFFQHILSHLGEFHDLLRTIDDSVYELEHLHKIVKQSAENIANRRKIIENRIEMEMKKMTASQIASHTVWSRARQLSLPLSVKSPQEIFVDKEGEERFYKRVAAAVARSHIRERNNPGPNENDIDEQVQLMHVESVYYGPTRRRPEDEEGWAVSQTAGLKTAPVETKWMGVHSTASNQPDFYTLAQRGSQPMFGKFDRMHAAIEQLRREQADVTTVIEEFNVQAHLRPVTECRWPTEIPTGFH